MPKARGGESRAFDCGPCLTLTDRCPLGVTLPYARHLGKRQPTQNTANFPGGPRPLDVGNGRDAKASRPA